MTFVAIEARGATAGHGRVAISGQWRVHLGPGGARAARLNSGARSTPDNDDDVEARVDDGSHDHADNDPARHRAEFPDDGAPNGDNDAGRRADVHIHVDVDVDVVVTAADVPSIDAPADLDLDRIDEHD